MEAASEAIALEETLVIGGIKAPDVDPKLPQQTFDYATVSRRLLQSLTAAITDQCATAYLKLITLGVTAKIVVIVENEDARTRILSSIEVCSRKTADYSKLDH